MNFILTQAGKYLLQTTPGVPPALNQFKLSGGYNYVPNDTQTELTGTEHFSGVPSLPSVLPDGVIQYRINLDNSIGDFYFGEVGLYHNGVLVIVGVASQPIQKTQLSSSQSGNQMAISALVTHLGEDVDVFAEIGNSLDNLSAEYTLSVESLPPAAQANPNIRIVPSPDGSGDSLAISAAGRWSITGYTELLGYTQITASSALHLTLNDPFIAPSFPGEIIVQAISGPASGLIRKVASYNSSTKTFTFTIPWSITPSVGTLVQIVKKTGLGNAATTLPDTAITSDDGNSGADWLTLDGFIQYIIANKQNTLSAGANIQIAGNVISATAPEPTLSAGEGISVLGSTITATPITVVTNVTVLSRPLGIVDENRMLRFISTGAKTLEVNPASNHVIGKTYHVSNRSPSGDLTISPLAGMTINPPKGGLLVLEPGDVVSLHVVATNVMDMYGSTKAGA